MSSETLEGGVQWAQTSMQKQLAQFLRIIKNKRIQLHTFKSRPHRGINTRHELIP